MTRESPYAGSRSSHRSTAQSLGLRNARRRHAERQARSCRGRAARGIPQFNERLDCAVEPSPARRLVDVAEVGRVVAFLVSGSASGMTGDTIYVDARLHIVTQS
ncbi:MAG: SDR family oxidoreductase [Methylocystis sp.]